MGHSKHYRRQSKGRASTAIDSNRHSITAEIGQIWNLNLADPSRRKKTVAAPPPFIARRRRNVNQVLRKLSPAANLDRATIPRFSRNQRELPVFAWSSGTLQNRLLK
jgi:hypothetical protein